MKVALLAEYLCNLQPPIVRSRLRHDETLGTPFGLGSRTVITIGGDMRVDQQKLFAVVRRAIVDQWAESLTDVDGHEIVVMVDQDQGFLESPSKGRKVRLDELMLLSPNQEIRARTLRRLIDLFGPTAPDFSALLTKAVECELSDEEVDALFAERASGVAALIPVIASLRNTCG